MLKELFGAALAVALALLNLLVSSDVAFSDKLACDLVGHLGPNIPNATSERQSFFEGGKNYPIDIHSLSEPAPWQQNFLCFRYEVVNPSNETIPLLFWKLIDDFGAQDLDTSRQRVRVRPSAFKDPIRAPTELSAFRRAHVEAEVWMSVEDAQKKAADANNPSLQFIYTKPTNYGGAIAKAVALGQLPDSEVLQVQNKGDLSQIPPVADVIENSSGKVRVSSYVIREKGAIFTEISARPASNKVRPRIFAPALLAMWSKSPEIFVSTLARLRESPESLEISTVDGTARIQMPSNAAANAPLFLVEHPITIRWEGNNPSSQCILVASYSAFPVNLGEDFCESKK
ncbi:hypothetical protein [Bradyrhizobium erythrophlei]|jgi:hypothetical protein|uniref:Uncharacterized protein n=1 Tax=Bradyrhizobium erythrophlei TaxID=1437360 RepID=A0A1M5HXN7_9BRAD|nr:hypothetical protein [Bradyrhizobium erythrophlei]SHG20623.1 hypothetical protein SAMN05444169_1123 [Bradyrhizobium erythrophlei]